jgi:hypothetical protein
MESLQNSHEIVHHDKRIGLITNNEVIIYSQNTEQKIELDAIKNIQIIKKRAYQWNTVYFLVSAIFFYFAYYFYFAEWIVTTLLFLIGAVVLFFVFYKKYYAYSIRIKDINHAVYKIESSQNHKGNVKKFYYKLKKQLPNTI